MSKGRILVVEDDGNIAKVVRHHFQKIGYEVVLAADGADGLDRVGETPFNAVICDLLMPRIGGIDFIRVARSANPHLAIVVISASPTAENVLSTLDLGAYRFLAKPFQLVELARVVELAMTREADRTTTVEHKDDWVEITASSDMENIDRLENFLALLAASALPPDDVDSLTTGFRQLMANAIEWGNNFDPSLRVKVAFRVKADRVEVRVQDEGTGFNTKSVDTSYESDAQAALQRLKDGRRAGGFGIRTVRELMDEVKYSAKGNEVVMAKYIRR
ncbi:MAG: response regulator [Planctomycetota bacterium]